MWQKLAAIVSACACAAWGAGLVDHPIVGDNQVYLDGNAWTVSNDELRVSAQGSVPGDLLTDLASNKVIPEPLFELNWKNSSIWDDYVWTYTRKFTATADQLAAVNPKTLGGVWLRWHFSHLSRFRRHFAPSCDR